MTVSGRFKSEKKRVFLKRKVVIFFMQNLL